MRADLLIPLVGAMVNLLLAFAFLWQNPRSLVARIFGLLALCFGIWNVGTFYLFRAQVPEESLFWARWLSFGLIWIPLTLLHLSCLLVDWKLPARWWRFAYGAHLLLSGLNFTPFLIRDAQDLGHTWSGVAGPGYWIVFLLFFSLSGSAAVFLFHFRRHQRLVRRRLLPVILVQLALAGFGCNDLLPSLGWLNYPLVHLRIYPFGSMIATVCGLIVAYSVLQHQIVHAQVVFGRWSAYWVRVLFFTLIAFALLMVAAELTGAISSIAVLAALVVGVISAMIVRLAFPNLASERSWALERQVLGADFEYQETVRKFIDGLAWYSDLQPLQADLQTVLLQNFRLRSYTLFLRHEITGGHQVAHSHPLGSHPGGDLGSEAPLVRFLRESRHDYLLTGAEQEGPASALEKQARAQVQALEAEGCIALANREELFGLLLIGPKENGDPYTATDLRLLIALARKFTLVWNQIRLKSQVQQAQELDLLGRMSRGMAHDLNNLLTPVSTLLQLSEESGRLNEELLPVASRNLATMRAYIREALFFSENLRPHWQTVRLDEVVRSAMEVARSSRPKAVHLRAEIPEGVVAELDGVLVQRLVANVLSNAIDASPEGGEIHLTLERLSRLGGPREWLRLRISDQGEGISRENLSRIFTPYFTTKNRGDNDRGFGLGLAICRKITTLHGGHLSIESQPRRGTTVQLDLPARHQEASAPLPVSSAA